MGSVSSVTVSMRSRGLIAGIVVLLAWTPAALGGSPAVLIRDATLITGSGDSIREGVDILVENGVIREIGEDLARPEATTIDAAGKTVLPGLIDCHTHLQSVPGAELRGDDRDARISARKTQLRAYVAAGVTTVLDAAAPPSVLNEMRAFTEESNLGPRIEGLAPILTPEHGYFADEGLRADDYPDLWAPIGEDLSLIDAHLDAAALLAPIGVKVTVEDGYGPLPVWPLFDDDALAYIKKSAAAHASPIFVHAIGAEEYRRALKLEPHAFVHGGFLESSPDADTLRAIKASGASVISTLAITDMMLLIWQAERLDDPWVRMLVPEPQRASAVNPEISERMLALIAQENSPGWMPGFLARFVASWLYNEASITKLRASALRATKAMHDAGIPIVMGSDMGNWPLLTSLFHAVGSIREMELLELAGVPRTEILLAATSRAAALIGKSEHVGTIEVGKKADLVIANRNPLDAGMATLRDLAFVMKNGEIRTPASWMERD